MVNITAVSYTHLDVYKRQVRGGIISIDPGQTEGAKAIGMNHYQTMTSLSLIHI